MKWIKYTMKNGTEAQVPVLESVQKTVEEIKSDMKDERSFTVVELEQELQRTTAELVQEQLTTLNRLESAKTMAIDNRLDFIDACLIEMAQKVYK